MARVTDVTAQNQKQATLLCAWSWIEQMEVIGQSRFRLALLYQDWLVEDSLSLIGFYTVEGNVVNICLHFRTAFDDVCGHSVKTKGSLCSACKPHETLQCQLRTL